ncbi:MULTISPECIES: inclusion body family protein [Pseudoalteromonas]|uniref:inclusion body family protein n=1 Tax=Pseudoalteromonas TaxID=53246 RepID=UPI0019D1CA4F|nr:MULTISPECIES: inclusion body family protein [Pseudoalteromonas]MBR8842173.1 inclusion body family protein [Pseudoalteromonas sp. JC3]UDM64051.1 inclusion body family protein [Pseudoalteromonas piscicida]WJE11552.1 inclusion body family protein [Pseudoalteromonas sp. JC3]
MSTLEASSESINVLIVIDTEYVKAHYPHPSQDQNSPTPIDHNSEFMIASDPRGIVSGQGTAVLNFRANAGDNVSFSGTSIYGNADDAVIIYGIKQFGGTQVFNTFVTNSVNRTEAAVPNVNSGNNNGLPAAHVSTNFMTLDSKVRNSGTENFQVQFALYTLSSDGQSQSLLGYYQWDPTITVS